MQESTLLKIALVLSVAGVLLLFFISKTIVLPEGKLMEQDSSYVVQGSIDRITQKDTVTFITLKRDDELSVVLFKNYPADLNQGDYVEIEGTASKDDEGNAQLIAKDIRVIR